MAAIPWIIISIAPLLIISFVYCVIFMIITLKNKDKREQRMRYWGKLTKQQRKMVFISLILAVFVSLLISYLLRKGVI